MIASLAAVLLAASPQDPPPPPPRPGPLVHGYVYFGSGSADPIRRTDIDPIDYLGPRVPPTAFVVVRGQTDTLGGAEANEWLARRRALAVADLLVLHGVGPEQITLEVCGERILNRPTADGVSEQLNRFVHFDWNAERRSTSQLGCPMEPYRP